MTPICSIRRVVRLTARQSSANPFKDCNDLLCVCKIQFASRRRGIVARRDRRIAAAAAGQHHLPYMVENRPFCGLISGVFERKIHPTFEVCSGKDLRFAVGAKKQSDKKSDYGSGAGVRVMGRW